MVASYLGTSDSATIPGPNCTESGACGKRMSPQSQFRVVAVQPVVFIEIPCWRLRTNPLRPRVHRQQSFAPRRTKELSPTPRSGGSIAVLRWGDSRTPWRRCFRRVASPALSRSQRMLRRHGRLERRGRGAVTRMGRRVRKEARGARIFVDTARYFAKVKK